MEYFTSQTPGRRHLIRIDPGEDVLESLNSFLKAENILNGVVVSGIGTFDQCVLHMVTTIDYPPQEHFERFTDTALELACIQGVVADGKLHLHCVVSDTKYAYAGHLEPGCRVLYLCEIVLDEIEDLSLHRTPNEKGIMTLHVKKN